MIYERLIRELCDAGVERLNEINEKEWLQLAWAYALENPSDAIQGLFESSTTNSPLYDAIIEIMQSADSTSDFARIGMLFCQSIQEEIREDVASKIAEYWLQYAEENFAYGRV